MLAVEAKVSCQQALFGRVHGAPPTPEVEEQPAQAQLPGRLVRRSARKKPLGATFLGAGKASLWYPPSAAKREHREVLAFNQSDADRCLACRLPRYARFGVQPLGEVDQLNEFVALLRING